MSNSIECEPYLDDYYSSFRSIFIPIDKSLNTSEIKPLHLALPRNRQGTRANQSPSRISGNNNINNNNEIIEEEIRENPTTNTEKKPTRFLTNRYTAQNESSKSGKDSKPKESTTASIYNKIEEVAQKVLPSNQNSNNIPNENVDTTPKQSKQKSKSQLTATTQNDREVIEMLIRNEDYWYLPLSPSIVIRLIFTVSSKYAFELLIDGEEVPLMSAEMSGQSRADGITIFIRGEEKGETHYTPGNSSLFAGVQVNDQKDEACATIFNPSFSSVSQPRIFDFLVPALKKINGRSRMLPILLDESSGLVARLSQMSKEAIRLKTRIPASQGSSFDMTFDGKFQQSSLSNFILYHDSNTRKDLCSLGMISEGRYLLEISYPLSPLQGFLAAISASAPIVPKVESFFDKNSLY